MRTRLYVGSFLPRFHATLMGRRWAQGPIKFSKGTGLKGESQKVVALQSNLEGRPRAGIAKFSQGQETIASG